MKRPSPALVISILALVAALGGTGYAALRIPSNSVGSSQVRDGSLLPRDLNRGRLASATVPSRQTLVGDYAAFGATSGFLGDQVTFRIPFATRFDGGHAQLRLDGDPATPECPGPGRAMAGYLCVYEDGGTNRARIGFESLEDFQGDNGADANGFHVVFRATAASGLPGSFSFGSWAATAP